MMDHYEEPRINNKSINRIDEAVQDKPEFLNCNRGFEGNQQNFEFGAEIVNTSSMPDNELASKTNLQKITITLSTTEPAERGVENDAMPSTTQNDMPIGISEAIVEIEEEKSSENDDELENDHENHDEEADSYQSEDENLNDTSQDGMQDESDRKLEDSDESTTDSDFSDLSGLTDVSGREWKPITARPMSWVHNQMHSGANPRELLSQIMPSGAPQIVGLNDMTLWRILASMLSEPPRRQKLRSVNTFEDVITLVKQAKNIIVLTGAGVSVSCGIPDFRSSDGIYSRLAKDYPDLPDPQAMFDINYFSRDPRPFFKFAREIYPGQFKPSPCHRFIKLLEEKQKLLRNYTQNIDTLEQVAGIKNVIECHGSFSTASCTKCKLKCDADAIRPDIFAQRIPVCPRCQPNVQQSVDASEPVSEQNLRLIVENGIMKPDIVFFGEGLPEEFHTVMASDKDKCDLLIVIGSSLKVRPVALIPSSIPAHVPQILINREQLHHLEFDVELLGDSDVIINQLCHHLGDDWKEICFNEDVLKESKELLPLEDEDQETLTDGGDANQQLQDIDTQSVKSSSSTDFAVRSACTYSDSGFESSTSSAIAFTPTNVTTTRNISNIVDPVTDDDAAAVAIEKIKSSIQDLNNSMQTTPPTTTTTRKCRTGELLSSDLLHESSVNPVKFASVPGFHPFINRLESDATVTSLPKSTATTCTVNYRHSSIDSSKDSGIHSESSNLLALPNTNGKTTSLCLPPVTDFTDSSGLDSRISIPISATTTTLLTNKTDHINEPTQQQQLLQQQQEQEQELSNVDDKINPECDLKRSRQQKRKSAAERLLNGTYYCHESSASYVFPGAQVSWSTDSEDEEEEDDDDEDDYEDEEFDGTDCDTNAAPLSPLLPPSVEAEMVYEIASSANRIMTPPPSLLSSPTTPTAVEQALINNESPKQQRKRRSPNTESRLINSESNIVDADTDNRIQTSAIEDVKIGETDQHPPIKKRRDLNLENSIQLTELPTISPTSSNSNNNSSNNSTSDNSCNVSNSSGSASNIQGLLL